MADSKASLLPGGTGEAGRWTDLVPPYAVFACSSVFFWSLSSRILLWTLMPAIAADLRLSTSLAGVAISSTVLGNNVGHWAAGWLPGSRRQRILISTLLSIPAAALVSASRDLVSLLVLGFVLGLVSGVYLPLGLAIITDAGGSSRKALYMSVHEVLASLASFSGATFAGLALHRVGWRISMLMSCTVGVLALLIFSRMRGGDSRSRAARQAPRLRLSWVLLYCCLGFASSTILMGGLMSVMPLIMVRAWGMDPAFAATLMGYPRLLGLLSNVVVGLRGDLWGHVRVLRGLQLLGMAGAAAMSVGSFGPLFIAGFLAVGLASAGMWTILPPVIASAFPAEHREQAMAASVAVGGILGSMVAPPFFGLLVDLGLPSLPMLLSAALVGLALTVTGRIPSAPVEVRSA